MNHNDSDSHNSDHDLHHRQNPQHPHRPKTQKHFVGGGAAAVRPHVRVPSSKALNKHHAPTSTTKLTGRHTSPSPNRGGTDGTAGANTGTKHRRAVSDPRLSRDSSSTSLALKKNTSQTSLKRNRSQVEFVKKSKSAGQLKRSQSNPTVAKLKSAKTQVHFDLGNEDGQDDEPEDEWVDASNSVSPYLSRRGSGVSSGQSSARPGSRADQSAAEATAPQRHDAATAFREAESKNAGSRGSSPSAAGTKGHNQALTARLLQRTTSHGAPPKMSTENVSVRPPSSQQHSPDSGVSRETTSTLSGNPADARLDGSSGKDMLTSRFINAGSQGSGLTREGSFYNLAQNGVYSQPNGKYDEPRRPRSTSNLQQRIGRQAGRADRDDDEDSPSSDDEDTADNGGLARSTRNRRSAPYIVPRSETSRTQQKLDLQRASSNLEPSRHPGLGMGIAGVSVAAGPLLGASGFENRDPRLGKLLDRADMEYLVVRRYQNPVARSIARLAQLPGSDRNRRIPRSGLAGSVSSDRHIRHMKRGSDTNSLRFGSGADHLHHQRESSGVGGYAQQGSRRPVTPGQNGSSLMHANGTGSSLDTEDDGSGGVRRMHHQQQTQHGEGLSGSSSLVDGEGDDDTLAILRNMWEKSMDMMSASQD